MVETNRITEATDGKVPSIVLQNPHFAHNVSMVTRLASCFGIEQVWFTGNRVKVDLEQRKRMPREERMKGYSDVEIINHELPLEQFPPGTVPVAVEVRPNSERLQDFQHPENAVYVFGPEDSSIHAGTLTYCHRFVVIPTRHGYCLNLATAVSILLWDRMVKLGQLPNEEIAFGDVCGAYEDSDPAKLGIYGEKGWPKK